MRERASRWLQLDRAPLTRREIAQWAAIGALLVSCPEPVGVVLSAIAAGFAAFAVRL